MAYIPQGTYTEKYVDKQGILRDIATKKDLIEVKKEIIGIVEGCDLEDISTITQTLNDNKQKITKLDSRTTSQGATITNLETRVTDVETKTNSNKTNINNVLNRVETLEKKPDSSCTCESNINIINNQISTINQSVTTLSNKVNSIDTTIQQKDEEISNVNTLANNLNTRLTTLENTTENCLEQKLVTQPYLQISNEAATVLGVENKSAVQNLKASEIIELSNQYGFAGYGESLVNKNKIQSLDSRVTTLETSGGSSGDGSVNNEQLTNLDARVTTLENNTTNALDQELSIAPALALTEEQKAAIGITDEIAATEQTNKASEWISMNSRTAITAVAQAVVNKNKIEALDTRVTELENNEGSGSSCSCPSDTASQLTSHSNSINTLNTRSSSQGASITSLETRMTDVETQSTSNKNNLNDHINDHPNPTELKGIPLLSGSTTTITMNYGSASETIEYVKDAMIIIDKIIKTHNKANDIIQDHIDNHPAANILEGIPLSSSTDSLLLKSFNRGMATLYESASFTMNTPIDDIITTLINLYTSQTSQIIYMFQTLTTLQNSVDDLINFVDQMKEAVVEDINRIWFWLDKLALETWSDFEKPAIKVNELDLGELVPSA